MTNTVQSRSTCPFSVTYTLQVCGSFRFLAAQVCGSFRFLKTRELWLTEMSTLSHSGSVKQEIILSLQQSHYMKKTKYSFLQKETENESLEKDILQF